MNNNIHIVSELQGILLEDNGNRAIKSIPSVMKSLRIQDRTSIMTTAYDLSSYTLVILSPMCDSLKEPKRTQNYSSRE